MKKQINTPQSVKEYAEGIVRLDKTTKRLVKRLRPGEIAIIDHQDIDRISAETLIECRPSAVVNAACSITGKYPNLGPILISSAKIFILDEVGPAIFDKMSEGTRIQIKRNAVFQDEEEVATGVILSQEIIEERMELSKLQLKNQLKDFAANTMEYLEGEKEILLEAINLPKLGVVFAHRHALIVVRGYDYKEDLRALRAYIRDMKPLLVGVDGGADALMEFGLKPSLIVGDMDSVSDEALRSGAELVVHGYTNGSAPGQERLNEMGLNSLVFNFPGTSEDIAMLTAYELGAELIVLVGSHSHFIEFLDKGRKGMASTFLVRMRLGATLIDAKGLSKLYKGKVKAWHLIVMVLAAMITISIIIAFSEPVRQFFSILALRFQVWLMKLQQLI